MKYHLVTTLLIIAALPLYVVGFAMGGTLLLAIALALEIWFWMRMVRRKPGLDVANGGR